MVKMFGMDANYAVGFCEGSGTFSLAAVLEDFNCLALEKDAKQKEGFEKRISIVQEKYKREVQRWVNKRTTKTKPPRHWAEQDTLRNFHFLAQAPK